MNDNPIEKIPTVKVYKWEFAELIKYKTVLSVMKSLVKNGKEYEAVGLLKLMFSEEEEE